MAQAQQIGAKSTQTDRAQSTQQTQTPVTPVKRAFLEPRSTSFEAQAKRVTQKFGDGSRFEAPHAFSPSSERIELGSDIAERISREMPRGRALAPSHQERFAQHFHRELDEFRIHDGAEANELAATLGARGFAIGRDLFFAVGAFAPGTPRGDGLLAHEILHGLQQSGGTMNAYHIQRNPADEPEPLPTWTGRGTDAGYSLDFSGAESVFTIKQLRLPKINNKIKGKSTLRGITTDLIAQPFHLLTRDEDRNTTQRTKWLQDVRANKTTIETELRRFAGSADEGSDPVLYLEVRRANQIFVGTIGQILQDDSFLIPSWDKRGEVTFYDVDHYVEHQLGGEDELANMWLLKNSVNRSAGTKIRNLVLASVNNLFQRARDDGYFEGRNASRDLHTLSRTPRAQNIHYTQVRGGEDLGSTVPVWMLSEIKQAKHIKDGATQLIRPLSLQRIQALGLDASGDRPENVLWFLSKGSRFYREINLSDAASPKYQGKALNGEMKDDFFSNFRIESVEFTPGVGSEENERAMAETDAQIGSITGKVRGGVGTWKHPETGARVEGKPVQIETEITLPLRFDPRYGYGAYIDRSGVREALVAAHVKKLYGLSPFELTQAGLGDDWSMGLSGIVTSDYPLFAGLQAGFRLDADGIFLDVSIPTERLNFGVFRVTEANMSVGYGADGLEFGGSARFAIEGVGTGSIEADTHRLRGQFALDHEFLDPAQVTVTYEDDQWLMEAELGVKEGVIPGLQGGSVHIGIGEDGFFFTGTALIIVPTQSEAAEITIEYSAENGIRMQGTLPLNMDRYPAVKNASITVLAQYDIDNQSWSLGGEGRAEFDLPYVNGEMAIGWNNGGFYIRGTGRVEVGEANGNFAFTASNLPLDEEGNPQLDGEVSDEFAIFGKGEVEIQLGEYLTGRAGLEYSPEGEITVSGGFALPPSVELFARTEYDRDLFRFPRLEFPIFGVSIPVVGSIGVFGFIGGAITGFARIGPGTLDDSEVGIEYTLGDPASLALHGETHFVFGMEAGVEVELSGGLGLGAAIADLTGEVGIEAGLKLVVDTRADLEIDWTPAAGLSLDLSLEASAEPKFTVGVFGRVAASVALYGEVWSERWDEQLAEFGSGLRIGVTLPASWSEAEGLNLDIRQAEFTYPTIDHEALAHDIMERIV